MRLITATTTAVDVGAATPGPTESVARLPRRATARSAPVPGAGAGR